MRKRGAYQTWNERGREGKGKKYLQDRDREREKKRERERKRKKETIEAEKLKNDNHVNLVEHFQASVYCSKLCRE